MAVQELHTTGLLFACVADKETEEVIAQISLKNYDLKYEGMVGTIRDAVKYLKENRSPQVLIIDISHSDLPINDIAKVSEVCEPGVEVIVIGMRNDVGVFRELVKLGIRDYLVKPLTNNHIVRSIENIMLEGQDRATSTAFSKFGKIVSFIGTRGGIGVTTLATNCGWLMAEKHSKRIGLLDPDLQLGTIAQFLDLEPSTVLQEILESPDRIDETLVDRFMVKYTPHFLIMCGQSPLQEIQKIKPDAFEPIIELMLESFHYTIFDLPRYMANGINLNLLGHSNIVVLVTDLSLVSLKDCHRYLEVFKHHRTTDQQIVIVINKQGEYKSGEIELSDFEEAIERKVDIIIPFDGNKPLLALTKGVPLASQGSSALISALEQLTFKIIGRPVGAPKGEKKGFNWFSLKKS